MTKIKDNFHNFCKSAHVVATVHSDGDLDLLERRGKVDPGVDVLEFRLDNLFTELDRVERLVEAMEIPLLFTVRRRDEGGVRELSAADRLLVLGRFLSSAAFVDVEVRSMAGPEYMEFRQKASEAGVATVASFHDFHATPSAERLSEVISQGREEGADIVKLAVYLDSEERLEELEQLVRGDKQPLSVMGMGPLGRESRPRLARAGSVLNYGYLREPNAPGQWPATELKALIEKP